MKKRETIRRLRLACRVAAVGVAVCAVVALPLDWGRLGCTVSLMAAGLRQPQNAAALLEKRLEAANHTDSTTPPSLPVQGTTAVTTPTTVPGNPLVSQTVLSIPPPGEKGNGGKIHTEALSTGDNLYNGVAITNKSGQAVDIAAALRAKLTQTWQDTDAPQVLIVHTHTTEQYMLYDAGYYNAGDRDRTTDQRQTVCAVGKAVAAQLKAAGVGVIHDTTIHDNPYSGAYSRSEATVQKYLKQHPTIRVVLDLHRDAIMANATDLKKPTVTVNGQKAAQAMIIVGTVSTNALPHPNREQNLALAAQWQKALNTAAPGLLRPLYTVASRYNQHLSPGYLLVEVGSEGNTVAEAVYSGQLLGKTLATLLDAKTAE